MVARDALWTPGSVVDAVDARLGMAALLATSGASSLDVATGVVGGPGDPLRVSGTADVGPMRVSVAAGHFIGSKGASNGPYIGCNDSPALIELAAAPASGSRYDRVWIRQRDAQAIVSPDADTAAEVGVTTGVSGTSPTEPAIPTGAVELALLQVNAGATATNGAGVTITDRRKWTGLRGGIITVPTEAALPPAGDGTFAVTLDTYRVWVRRAGAWTWAPWALGMVGRAWTTQTTGPSTDGTEVPLNGISVTVAGVPAGRRFELLLKTRVSSSVAGDRMAIKIKDGATVIDTALLPLSSTLGTTMMLATEWTPAAGTRTFQGFIQRANGAGSWQTTASETEPTLLLVKDAGPA